MFKDIKSNGLGMEDTWTTKLQYFKNIMLCISIGYVYLMTIGCECGKMSRNKEIGVFLKQIEEIKREYIAYFK
ncbi:MAG: hypothetical protein HFJ60_01240 [Clostridia bacterium]|jgi:hypothetical protein|nr:hypothetical protein [Clostridia bacterium]